MGGGGGGRTAIPNAFTRTAVHLNFAGTAVPYAYEGTAVSHILQEMLAMETAVSSANLSNTRFFHQPWGDSSSPCFAMTAVNHNFAGTAVAYANETTAVPLIFYKEMIAIETTVSSAN